MISDLPTILMISTKLILLSIIDNISFGDYILNNVVVIVGENQSSSLLLGIGTLNKFKNALKKGDLVVTKGGIHGKIIEVNDSNDTCVIETMAGKVKMERSFVSHEMSKQRATPAKK